ncbi:MAG TPA: CHAT domain-containing tetratricopeptide repeat protein [Blastocatellia bacterium]|nr:CHAT domain-containing tetratricopeptide repeat protein [Blastocatellia bacterium]
MNPQTLPHTTADPGGNLSGASQIKGLRQRVLKPSVRLLVLLKQAALCYGALLWLSSLAGGSSVKASQDEIGPLDLGRPVERELAGGQAHSYRVSLNAGQYLRVMVDQKGVDVAMTFFGPDETKLAEIILPHTLQGRKVIIAVAEASGNHRLELRSQKKDAAAGRYEVQILELREAAAEDRTRVAVRKLVAEASDLRLRGTAESLTGAIKKLEEALPLIRSIRDRYGESEALANMGMAYFVLADYQKTIEMLNLALAIWREAGDRQGQSVAYITIANAQSAMGEWEKVIESLKKGLLINQAQGDRFNEAGTLSSISSHYLRVGDMEKAMEYANLALPIRREVKDRSGEVQTLITIGSIHKASGDLRKAIEVFEQALALRPLADRRAEASLLGNLGVAYAATGDTLAAHDYLKQSLPLTREVGDRRLEASVLRAFGEIYHLLGQMAKAHDYFNESLPIARAIGDRESEARSLYFIARAHRDLNQLREARRNIEAAISIIESLRSRISDQQQRSSYFATVGSYYDLYIDLLMRQRDVRDSENLTALAIEASERSRARSLLDLLVEARIEIRQDVDPELLNRERTLQQALNTGAEQQIRLLSGKHTKERAEMAARRVASLTDQLQEVRAQIRAANPRYAALTQPEPLSLEQIQAQALDGETLLLEYALGDKRSYVWAVTQTAVTGYELPGRAEIEAAARRFYELVKANAKREEIEEAATRLSQMALAPAVERFGKRRLAIVADGALQYVPFAALPLPLTRSPEGVRVAYTPLMVEHEIVMLPSASALAVLRRETEGRAPSSKLIAVLADPVFDGADVRVRRAAAARESEAQIAAHIKDSGLLRSVEETGLADGRWPLPRLLGTRREARAILDLAPAQKSRQAMDFEASRETAVDGDLSQYQIVHFATHGLINNRHPELSGLVLSLVDKQGRAQNGFLRLNEIYNLRLPAELVVLSACQTGLGKEVREEGFIGLTRGFMYAGARRLMASLWQVDDAATSELMGRFYRGMLGDKRLSPASALRAAQIDLWKQKGWQSPYYWAAFAIQGEWK